INGAAIATIISQFTATVSCALYARKVNPFFRFQRSDFVISLEMSYKVVKLGIPISLQFALIAISSMALQRIVNSYGTVVVAAFTSTSRIEQLIHQPYATLGASIATYCGQNYGARKNDRVYMGYKKGLLVMAVITVFVMFVMQFFGRFLMGLFVSDAQVIELGTKGLRITSAFYLALGTIYVVRGVLTGMGDAFFALFNGIIEVIGRFTLPLLMTHYMGMGETGIWYSTGAVWILSGVTAWLRYYTRFHSQFVGGASGQERS
ncbi:MAG: hypothetical protein IJU95_09850, partial [Treponema sp.]|nr:hypothetical protein [Treponema sp.]